MDRSSARREATHLARQKVLELDWQIHTAEILQRQVAHQLQTLNELKQLAEALAHIGDPNFSLQNGAPELLFDLNANKATSAVVGRQQVVETADNQAEAPAAVIENIADLSIAQAAVHAAQRRSRPTARTQEIMSWLAEDGYRDLTRSSAYQALLNAARRDDSGIKNSETRGMFAFTDIADDDAPALDLGGLTLIDAARAVTVARGRVQAGASEVAQWLTEAGFKTRMDRSPTRASIYTALQNAVDADILERAEERGQFLLGGAKSQENAVKNEAVQYNVEDVDLSNCTLVEAALRLAKAQGVTRASAADVHKWLTAAGFETRTGIPNYRTVHSSLTQEMKKKRPQIQKSGERGIFLLEPPATTASATKTTTSGKAKAKPAATAAAATDGGRKRKGRRRPSQSAETVAATSGANGAAPGAIGSLNDEQFLLLIGEFARQYGVRGASASTVAGWLVESDFPSDMKTVNLRLAKLSQVGRVRMDSDGTYRVR